MFLFTTHLIPLFNNIDGLLTYVEVNDDLISELYGTLRPQCNRDIAYIIFTLSTKFWRGKNRTI